MVKVGWLVKTEAWGCEDAGEVTCIKTTKHGTTWAFVKFEDGSKFWIEERLLVRMTNEPRRIEPRRNELTRSQSKKRAMLPEYRPNDYIMDRADVRIHYRLGACDDCGTRTYCVYHRGYGMHCEECLGS